MIDTALMLIVPAVVMLAITVDLGAGSVGAQAMAMI
jgi:hypothetical protein